MAGMNAGLLSKRRDVIGRERNKTKQATLSCSVRNLSFSVSHFGKLKLMRLSACSGENKSKLLQSAGCMVAFLMAQGRGSTERLEL